MARERWQAGVEFASLSLNEICTKHAALCGALSGCSCVWLGRPACSVQRVSSAVHIYSSLRSAPIYLYV
jgi:hypothetical protein